MVADAGNGRPRAGDRPRGPITGRSRRGCGGVPARCISSSADAIWARRAIPAAEFELALDGVVRDRWTLTFDERNFLRFLDIPEVSHRTGDYARLTVASRAAGGDARGRRCRAAVRHSVGERMLYGFGEGWHEEEYDR